jgi:hypothetical protein
VPAITTVSRPATELRIPIAVRHRHRGVANAVNEDDVVAAVPRKTVDDLVEVLEVLEVLVIKVHRQSLLHWMPTIMASFRRQKSQGLLLP